jgi:hypothetical protein
LQPLHGLFANSFRPAGPGACLFRGNLRNISTRSAFRPDFSYCHVSNPQRKPRFSREEFCALIDAHLHQLEAHEEAKRRYAAVLAAIRQNLDVYTKGKKAA